MAEIVHKGPLDMAAGLVGEKSNIWKKRLFVLKCFKSSGTAALEFYKDLKKDVSRQEVKGVLNLMDNYQVKIINPELTSCRRKFTFDVQTLETTYRLAADSEAEMDDWVHYLQIQTKLKPAPNLGISFHVRPQQTGANARLRAKGDCLLQMSQQGIKLAQRSTGSILAEWPLKCLRRYACDNGQFCFEAGRKAPFGEGVYGFLANEEETMFDVLDYLVKAEAGQLVSPPTALTQRTSTMAQPDGYHHLVHAAVDRAPPPVPLPPRADSGDQQYSVLSSQGRSLSTSPPTEDCSDGRTSYPSGVAQAEYNTLQHQGTSSAGNADNGVAMIIRAQLGGEYNTLGQTTSQTAAVGPATVGTYDTLNHSNTASRASFGSQRSSTHSDTSVGEYQNVPAVGDHDELTINAAYGQPLRYGSGRRGT